jgi:hypothetical protein
MEASKLWAQPCGKARLPARVSAILPAKTTIAIHLQQSRDMAGTGAYDFLGDWLSFVSGCCQSNRAMSSIRVETLVALRDKFQSEKRK